MTPAARAITAMAPRSHKRFKIDEPRIRPDDRLHVGGIGRVHERRVDAKRRELGHQQVVRAGVDGVGRHDVVARFDDREQGRRDRRHAAGRRERGVRVFQRGHLAFKGRHGRIAPSGIDERLFLAGKDGGTVLGGAQVIRRRQVQGRDQRAGGRVGRLTRMNSSGVDAECAISVGHECLLPYSGTRIPSESCLAGASRRTSRGGTTRIAAMSHRRSRVTRIGRTCRGHASSAAPTPVDGPAPRRRPHA
jgi:hypothetical protein